MSFDEEPLDPVKEAEEKARRDSRRASSVMDMFPAQFQNAQGEQITIQISSVKKPCLDQQIFSPHRVDELMEVDGSFNAAPLRYTAPKGCGGCHWTRRKRLCTQFWFLMLFFEMAILALAGIACYIIFADFNQQALNSVAGGLQLVEATYDSRIEEIAGGLEEMSKTSAVRGVLTTWASNPTSTTTTTVQSMLSAAVTAREMEFATLVDTTGKIVASANTDRQGESWDPSGLVTLALAERKTVLSTETLTYAEYQAEGPPTWRSRTFSDTPLSPLHPVMIRETAVIQWAIAPVWSYTDDFLGLLVAGDVQDGKGQVVDRVPKLLTQGVAQISLQYSGDLRSTRLVSKMFVSGGFETADADSIENPVDDYLADVSDWTVVVKGEGSAGEGDGLGATGDLSAWVFAGKRTKPTRVGGVEYAGRDPSPAILVWGHPRYGFYEFGNGPMILLWIAIGLNFLCMLVSLLMVLRGVSSLSNHAVKYFKNRKGLAQLTRKLTRMKQEEDDVEAQQRRASVNSSASAKENRRRSSFQQFIEGEEDFFENEEFEKGQSYHQMSKMMKTRVMEEKCDNLQAELDLLSITLQQSVLEWQPFSILGALGLFIVFAAGVGVLVTFLIQYNDLSTLVVSSYAKENSAAVQVPVLNQQRSVSQSLRELSLDPTMRSFADTLEDSRSSDSNYETVRSMLNEMMKREKVELIAFIDAFSLNVNAVPELLPTTLVGTAWGLGTAVEHALSYKLQVETTESIQRVTFKDYGPHTWPASEAEPYRTSDLNPLQLCLREPLIYGTFSAIPVFGASDTFSLTPRAILVAFTMYNGKYKALNPAMNYIRNGYIGMAGSYGIAVFNLNGLRTGPPVMNANEFFVGSSELIRTSTSGTIAASALSWDVEPGPVIAKEALLENAPMFVGGKAYSTLTVGGHSAYVAATRMAHERFFESDSVSVREALDTSSPDFTFSLAGVYTERSLTFIWGINGLAIAIFVFFLIEKIAFRKLYNDRIGDSLVALRKALAGVMRSNGKRVISALQSLPKNAWILPYPTTQDVVSCTWFLILCDGVLSNTSSGDLRVLRSWARKHAKDLWQDKKKNAWQIVFGWEIPKEEDHYELDEGRSPVAAITRHLSRSRRSI